MKSFKIFSAASLFFFCLFLYSKTYSQAPMASVSSETLTASFCGKSGNGNAISMTVDELKKCDWKIIVSDPNYVISSAKLSLVTKDSVKSYIEYELTGELIPEEYRNEILNSKRMFLEFISVKNKTGDRQMTRPIAVVIKEK